jgi:type II secretory pathway pseudopilin PulG
MRLRSFVNLHHSPRRHAAAFSLLELIVVIGIITILIGLLLPSLVSARRQAQTVQCASQLRQLGQALLIYANSNRGYLPTWSSTQVYPDGKYGPPDDLPGLGWTEQLIPYFIKADSPAYRCPAFPDDAIDYFIAARWEYVNDVRTIQFARIRTSTAFIVSGDCTASEWHLPPFGTATTRFDDCDKDDAKTQCLRFFGEPQGINIHRAGNNILFGDLHVALFKAWDAQSMTYSPRAMQNYDGVTGD